MNKAKRLALEEAGFEFTTAEDFLGLTPDECEAVKAASIRERAEPSTGEMMICSYCSCPAMCCKQPAPAPCCDNRPSYCPPPACPPVQIGHVNLGVSHFGARDDDWNLLEGCGSRAYYRRVEFSRPFSRPPCVEVSIKSLDAIASDCCSDPLNTRVHVGACCVDHTCFWLEVTTWDNSKIWGIGVTWIAVER
jgi:hypothetical protein